MLRSRARVLLLVVVESVSRVVFISTPHGGSFLTRNRLSGLVSGLISIPVGLMERVTDLLQRDPDSVALKSLEELPTSLDNMRPGNPFLEALRQLAIVDAVDVHSIVAVRGDGPYEKLSDGVVHYVSAHIARGTERLVRSDHSAQRHPEAVAEVRRILREHLALAGQRARQAPAPARRDQGPGRRRGSGRPRRMPSE